MSERKDEKWLDEQLQRAVNGRTPAFDAQAWKQKYSEEYKALVARGKQTAGRGSSYRFGMSGRSWWGRLAIAAAILITGGVLLVGRLLPTPEGSSPRPLPVTRESPAQMVSMISLSVAFRSGGMEGLDKQCERALERLGPRPTSVSVQELLKDIGNKG